MNLVFFLVSSDVRICMVLMTLTHLTLYPKFKMLLSILFRKFMSSFFQRIVVGRFDDVLINDTEFFCARMKTKFCFAIIQKQNAITLIFSPFSCFIIYFFQLVFNYFVFRSISNKFFFYSFYLNSFCWFSEFLLCSVFILSWFNLYGFWVNIC